jgi:hypothetical protein
MMVVVMVVVAMRGESRRRDHKQKRDENNKLLHGKNVARVKFVCGRKNRIGAWKPTCAPRRPGEVEKA